MAQEIKVIIKDIPPSNNKYMGNSHSFKKYGAEKQKWEWLVRAGVKKKPPAPIEKANVTIVYYFKDRRRHDPDNYSGKFLLDGLVKSGILEDDSFENVNLILRGSYDKSNPRTEILINEII